jgi:monothiol glutaredoxin
MPGALHPAAAAARAAPPAAALARASHPAAPARRFAGPSPAPARRAAPRAPAAEPAGLASAPGAAPGAGLEPELRAAIAAFISQHKVCVFIKGTKEFPQCGFSNTVVQILNACEAPFVAVNVLEDDLIRSGMKEYSAWPTFPQVYLDGEFFGGADILIASYQSGELAEALEAALAS